MIPKIAAFGIIREVAHGRSIDGGGVFDGDAGRRALERFPIPCNHGIGRESLKFNELELP